MEQLAINNSRVISELPVPLEAEEIVEVTEEALSDDRFIGANTHQVSYRHLKEKCTIPVFAKDNESTISHQEFVDIVSQAAHLAFQGEHISEPAIRVSHPIKGRIPEAVGKPAKDLVEREKTIYYERMAFLIEIPSISEDINGNSLALSLGGVRAYNVENLYGRKTEEKFRVFIGYKNRVCCNLCVSSDGYLEDLRTRTVSELFNRVVQLFGMYNMDKDLRTFESLSEYVLSERQFAQLVGRLRMYQFLKPSEKVGIPPLTLGDSQVNSVIRGYYHDKAFQRDAYANLDMWRFYNLLTGAYKSSYIDTFLDRTVNTLSFTRLLLESLKTVQTLWYLDGQ
ncbi:MAG: DUF3871 family protein [Bacteroidota bacterium]|nr:DUF3871 family protein [Bacteroidota bacterium]